MVASLRKKQCNVYNSRTRSIKLIQKKLPTRWDILLEIKESEYQKDIMTY